MQALKYSFFLNKLLKKLNSKALVDDLLIFIYKPYYNKLLSLYIFYYHLLYPTLLSYSYPPILFLYCFALVIID